MRCRTTTEELAGLLSDAGRLVAAERACTAAIEFAMQSGDAEAKQSSYGERAAPRSVIETQSPERGCNLLFALSVTFRSSGASLKGLELLDVL